MTDHPSNPDLLMSRMLGVCWHSPTSDRWPCQVPLADWERELLRPCGACGCTEASHGAYETDSGCRVNDCECDAFEGPEAAYEPPTCGCDQDPIECNHEAALGEAEEKLRRVLAVCDHLDERYLNGDGKTVATERQAGKCAGYSLAAHLIRQALA